MAELSISSGSYREARPVDRLAGNDVSDGIAFSSELMKSKDISVVRPGEEWRSHVRQLKDGTKRLEDRMDCVEDGVKQLDIRMDRLETSMRDLENRIDAKLQSFEDRFDAKLQSLDERIEAKLDSFMAKMEGYARCAQIRQRCALPMSCAVEARCV